MRPDPRQQRPYGAGWIVRLRPSNWDGQKGELHSGSDGVEDYAAFLAARGDQLWLIDPGNGIVHRGCLIPPDLLYDVPRDVWIRPEADGTIILGMTDVAQTRSGKVLHILFKKVGRRIEAGQSAATIESAKWAGPFPTPVAGTVTATNEDAFAADILDREPRPVRARLDQSASSRTPGTRRRAGLVTGIDAIGALRARIEELGSVLLPLRRLRGSRGVAR